MLEFLKRIFNSGGAEERGPVEPPQQVIATEDLRRIEAELGKENRGRQQARLLNRAGDLYLVKGDRKEALTHYGEAIDAYLQAGEYDNAMAVCRKIIRVVPEVIRTRRTLAWLCLGKGFLEIAREHIEAYVDASKDAGLESLAVQQLQLMGQYVEEGDFREFLAARLDELEDSAGATKVREGHASESVRASGWTPVIFAAMLTPEELRRAIDKGIDIKAPSSDREAAEFESLMFDFKPAEEEKRRKGDKAAGDPAKSKPKKSVDDEDDKESSKKVADDEGAGSTKK